MGVYGYQCVSVYRCRWGYEHAYGGLWGFMGVYGYLWGSMEVWINMSIRVFMDVYGSLCMAMGL